MALLHSFAVRWYRWGGQGSCSLGRALRRKEAQKQASSSFEGSSWGESRRRSTDVSWPSLPRLARWGCTAAFATQHTHTHTPESCEKWKGSLTPPPHAQDWRGTQTNLDQVVAVFVKPWHQRLQRDGGVSWVILLVWPREHSGVRLCDKALRCHSNDCSVFHAVATQLKGGREHLEVRKLLDF